MEENSWRTKGWDT